MNTVQSERPGSRNLLNIPNQLTILRLVLSVVFFVLLGLLGHGTFAGSGQGLVLNLSAALFVLAVATDFLDGFLARRWGLVSTFGRIADPFVDKIVICGGFIMLIGVSRLIEPWFAVVIVFREFLVSGLRSFLESRGTAFGAALSGKLKMVVQSITIPVVIVYEANFAATARTSPPEPLADSLRLVTMAFLALTLVLTLASCVGYVQRAVRLLRRRTEEP
jgi:CDP-diacylglycerol--glycerol-3-phosphate 3-phosphatidyltransferase